MKAVIVYESIFGNTKKVAEAVAIGIGGRYEVTLVEVGEANDNTLDGIDLLVVGGPTHVWSMSRGLTRMVAKRQMDREPISKGLGVRNWLPKLQRVEQIPAAAFDTAFRRKGSAARGIASRLRRRGYRLVASPEQFYILSDMSGPLLEGELKRATEWGQGLTEIAITES